MRRGNKFRLTRVSGSGVPPMHTWYCEEIKYVRAVFDLKTIILHERFCNRCKLQTKLLLVNLQKENLMAYNFIP